MKAKVSGVARGLAAAAGLVACGAASLAGTALPPGGFAYKTHASVSETPKFDTTAPSYFTPGNIVGTLMSPIVGGLQGMVTTTVYRNPANDCLAFQFFFEAADDIASPIVRATLGGGWTDVDIIGAGADASGSSGTGDPSPEWTDGDPMFIARSPVDGGVAFQWRMADVGSGLGAGDMSSLIWLETDEKFFEPAPLAVIDTALVGTATILAPSAFIPLPGAAAMGLLGLAPVASRRRRGVR